MLNPQALRIIELLDLRPLPQEGGYFRETYRSGEKIPAEALPARYASRACGRNHSTQIYFLLAPGLVSLMHLVQSDEVFHHYAGDAAEQLQIWSEGTANIVTIGKDIERGERPQVVVPRGVWQGCRALPGGPHGFTLLGCTVSPGFEWADFRLGTRAEMHALCRTREKSVDDLIQALAPESLP